MAIEEPAHLLAEARALRKEGRTEAAVARYTMFLERVPGTPAAWVELHDLLIGSGAHEDASAVLDTALVHAPHNPRLRLRGLERAFAQDPSADVTGALRELLTEHPSLVNGHVLLARALCNKGAYAEAMAAIRALEQAAPDARIAALRARLECLVARGGAGADDLPDPELAQDFCARPPDAVLLARVLVLAGEQERAEGVLDALRAMPETPKVLRALGQVAGMLGDQESVEESMHRVLELGPMHHGIRVKLARRLFWQGERARALALLDEGIALSPGDEALELTRAYFACVHRPRQKTMKHWVTLLQTTNTDDHGVRQLIYSYRRLPNTPWKRRLLTGLGKRATLSPPLALFAMQAFRDAAEEEQALAIAGRLDLDLARDGAWIGHFVTAFRWAQAGHLLAPLLERLSRPVEELDVPACLTLASLVEVVRGLDAALPLLRQTVARHGAAPDAWLALIDALVRTGRADEVSAAMEALPHTLADHAALIEARAGALWTDGDLDGAVALLERALPRPDGFALSLRLAAYHGWLGRTDLALETVGPTDGLDAARKADAHMTIARALVRALDMDGAGEHVALAMQIAPRARLHFFACWAAISRFDVAEAHALMVQRGGPRAHTRPRVGYLGELVNELRLDPDLSDALAAARAGPDPATDLLHLAARAPGHTPAAIGVLQTLFRPMTAVPPRPVEAAGAPPRHIPPVIWQYWEGTPVPVDVARALRRMQDHNPWAEHRVFDRRAARDYLAAHGSDRVQRAFRLCRHPAERADLLRLAVLWAEGGIHVDVDDVCRGSVADLLAPDTRFAAVLEACGSLGNNVLAAEPGHPVIGRALEDAVSANLSGAVDSIWLRTGPGVITRAFVAEMAAHGRAEVPAGCVVWPMGVVMQRLAMCRTMSYEWDARNWQRA